MKKALSLVLSLAIVFTMFLGLIPSASAASGLYVSGTKLYDGNGSEIVLRGANVPYAWYKSDSLTAINALANLGANSVRVVCGTGSKYDKTTSSELSNIINTCNHLTIGISV